MRLSTRWLAAAAMAAVAGSAGAQTTINMSASVTVPTILKLTVTNSGALVFTNSGTAVQADFDNGYIAGTSSNVVSTASNVTHSVLIWTSASTMSNTGASQAGNAPYAKPTTDLLWSLDAFATAGHGVVSAANLAAATAASGTKIISASAPGVHANAQTVNWRMALSYANDTPSTYSLNFFYTMVAD